MASRSGVANAASRQTARTRNPRVNASTTPARTRRGDPPPATEPVVTRGSRPAQRAGADPDHRVSDALIAGPGLTPAGPCHPVADPAKLQPAANKPRMSRPRSCIPTVQPYALAGGTSVLRRLSRHRMGAFGIDDRASIESDPRRLPGPSVLDHDPRTREISSRAAFDDFRPDNIAR